VSLNWLGEVKLQKGDEKGALAAYKESYDIRHRLAAQGQDGPEAQRDLSISLDHLGDLELLGDIGRQRWKAALAAYQESFYIFLKLAAQDPNSASVPAGLDFSLGKMADPAQKRAVLNEGLTIVKMLNLTSEQMQRAELVVRIFLSKLS
jgi:hypothetical protein